MMFYTLMGSGYAKTLALTPDGDLKLNSLNRLEWVSDERAVIQRLKVTLATIKEEDPFDEEHGLDAFEIAGGTEAELELELVETLSRDPGVDSVDSIEIEFDEEQARRAVADIHVTLVEGEEVQFGVGL